MPFREEPPHFVREIHGSYTNVVGLPTCELVETLHQLGAL